LQRITKKAIEDIDMNPYDINCKSKFKACWWNFMKKNEYNPPHNHTGTYSFVVYIDVPEEIRLEYKDQTGNYSSRGLIQFFSSRTNSQMLFNPKTADILIFKSDHVHQVFPFKSNAIRISLAGNVYNITYTKE